MGRKVHKLFIMFLDFEILTIVVVGLPIDNVVSMILRRLNLSDVNKVKESKLGNFKTLIYTVEVLPESFIETRKLLLKALCDNRYCLEVLMPVTDKNTIYVFFKQTMELSRS